MKALERSTFAPGTIMLGRVPIFSPTDKKVKWTVKNGKDWPYSRDEVDGGSYGRAVIEWYRPTERGRSIIQAIFKVGSYPKLDAQKSGIVEFNVKLAAKIANCPRHATWMLEELERIGKAEITLFNGSGSRVSWFHILSQIDMIDDKTARVYFTAGFMRLWEVDYWVHCESLVSAIAKIESPRVRAIVQRNITHGVDFDETLDQALHGIDAMRVCEREQRERRAEVRRAEADGTLATFGLSLYKNENTGVEHVRLTRKVLNSYGLVQLPPLTNEPVPSATIVSDASAA